LIDSLQALFIFRYLNSIYGFISAFIPQLGLDGRAIRPPIGEPACSCGQVGSPAVTLPCVQYNTTVKMVEHKGKLGHRHASCPITTCRDDDRCDV